jgi:HTH-type transcriptional regulator/antitoxin HigA
MSATPEYRELLAHEAPSVPRNDRAYERMLKRVERLMDEPKLSVAESKLLELLIVLVEAYEDTHEPVDPAAPIDMLRELMAANDMTQADLAKIFRSKGIASEVLAGKRSLSKAHIAKLAHIFHVSPAVFFLD